MLLVSHDRALLDAVAERTLAIENGTVRSYDGGWAEYAQRRAERSEPAAEPKAKPSREPKPDKPRPERRRPKELDEIEARIEAQEKVISSLEAQLAEDWGNADAIQAHRRARDELQALFARWERLVDEVAT